MTELLEPVERAVARSRALRGETSRRQPLREPAEATGDRAEVLEPVVARPDLEPVDDHPEAVERARGEDGEQRRVQRRRLDDVIAPTVGEQMAEHGQREAELNRDASAAVDVELHRRSHSNHVDPADVRVRIGIPLQPCEIRNPPPARGEPLCQRAVPALAAAHGIRVQTVEDEANAQVVNLYRLLMAPEPVHGGSNLESTDVSQAAELETMSARVPRTALRTLAIVPALNEEDTVGAVVDELRAFDPEIEILVVDDGSTDHTALVARQHGARVVSLPFNLGIGGAMQTGFRYAFHAGFDAAVQVDGDGQHDPAELSKLLVPLHEDRADIVVGSRFAGERTYRAPFFRRLGIALFARTISLIARQRVTDTTSGFRAMNRHGIALFAADYPHDYPEVEATVMVVRNELRLLEVPVAMRDRAGGRSSITASQSVYYMTKVLLAIFVSLFRRSVVPLKEDH